ncbi:MAG: hypothetical protein GY937_20370 [bacterium]|nr:hypothetical protein [bacterium]
MTDLNRAVFSFPLRGYLAHRLCRGDEDVRAATLASLRRLPSSPQTPPRSWRPEHWLRFAHADLLDACLDPLALCDWVREAIPGENAHPGRDLLWMRLATCGARPDHARFEREPAPEEALIRYARTMGSAGIPSMRLERVLRRRIEKGDPAGFGEALDAFASLDRNRTANTLVELLDGENRENVRWAISRTLVRLSDPEAAKIGGRECRRSLEKKIEAWRARGSPRRGSPPHYGDPCSRSGGGIFPPGTGFSDRRPEKGHPGVRAAGWLDKHATALRNLTLRVRPDLDHAIIVERLPALDAMVIEQGYRPRQVFVNGDAIIVPVPLDIDEPDPEEVLRLAAVVEEALKQPRVVEAYLGDRRFTLEFPTDDRPDLVLFLNELLAAEGSLRRLESGAGWDERDENPRRRPPGGLPTVPFLPASFDLPETATSPR